jgi:hypothetical protein
MNGIHFYHNHQLFDQYGNNQDIRKGLVENDPSDIVIDIESIPEIRNLDEVIIIPQKLEEEAKNSVIDFNPFSKEKNDDIIIVMDEPAPAAYDKENRSVIIDVYDEVQSALNTIPNEIKTTDQLSKILLNLKTYDSSLKILSNMFKILGMKEEFFVVKKIRGIEKYLQSMRTVVSGKTTFDISKLNASAFQRKEWISSVFTVSGLLSDTLEFVSKELKDGKFTDYIGNYGTTCERISSLAMNSSSSLKLLYKLSSLEANIKNQHIQTILVLRSGLEAIREVTKIAILLSGYSHPMIATTLAVTGIVSGSAGLYLMFNSQ